MPLATYKDLCIDVTDARVEGAFWATMLGWSLEMHDDGDAHLRDADGRIQAARPHDLDHDPEQLERVGRAHHEVVVGVEAAVEVEAAQSPGS